MTKREEAITLINSAQKVTFLTGAGVSVPSGIPDYRSLDGVYHGLEEPEYLLSHTCLMTEPRKFYAFVTKLYHQDAQPNVIHRKMVGLADSGKKIRIVTQNIDQLHHKAGSRDVINFHGNLYDCYCQKCQQTVPAAVYLQDDQHRNCGGQLRPNVVLYEEGLAQAAIDGAIEAVASADVVVIVGTSFKVYPFASLVQYKSSQTPVVVINQEPIILNEDHLFIKEDAASFFGEL